jgi:putative PIN family toxin of toxin-antitoxin system
VAASAERVVLDTNVLLSAVLFGGRPGELVELARKGRIRAVVSLHILDEFQRVLTSRRFGVSLTLAHAIAQELATFMDVVPVSPGPDSWASDPDDDPVVETALQGGASVICTGDRQLLLAAVPGVRIVTVAEMLAGAGGTGL